MRPRNPLDAAHLEGAGQVERFLKAQERAGDIPPGQARLHADNAFVLVEFLANTYPKVPSQANERDLWVFLFDYYISQGPFEGPAVPLAPRSIGLFFEFVARERKVPEIAYIRSACAMEEFYRHRVQGWAAIAQAADDGRSSPEELDDRVAAWQAELGDAMRPRGLVPDTALAGGEGAWGQDMGPMEAAVFDALCVVLARQARDLTRHGVMGDEAESRLLRVQDTFMRAHNPGLGTSPLEAVLRERAAAEAPEDEGR